MLCFFENLAADLIEYHLRPPRPLVDALDGVSKWLAVP